MKFLFRTDFIEMQLICALACARAFTYTKNTANFPLSNVKGFASRCHLPLRNLSPLFVLMAKRPIVRLFLTLCMVAVAYNHTSWLITTYAFIRF